MVEPTDKLEQLFAEMFGAQALTTQILVEILARCDDAPDIIADAMGVLRASIPDPTEHASAWGAYFGAESMQREIKRQLRAKEKSQARGDRVLAAAASADVAPGP
jgi:hypothetical protein